MTTEIVIALIVSGLALFGTIISLIVSFITQKSIADRQYQHSKEIKNYELYINKKHTVYLDLWSNLIKCIALVNNQRGLKERIPLEEMNKKDFRYKLNNLPLNDKQRKDWLLKLEKFQSATNSNKSLINKEWFQLLSKVDVISAKPFIEKTKYEYTLNQPFLSKDLDNYFNSVLFLLLEIAIIREIPSEEIGAMKEDRQKVENNMKLIEKYQNNILKSMRLELVNGKYTIIGK